MNFEYMFENGNDFPLLGPSILYKSLNLLAASVPDISNKPPLPPTPSPDSPTGEMSTSVECHVRLKESWTSSNGSSVRLPASLLCLRRGRKMESINQSLQWRVAATGSPHANVFANCGFGTVKHCIDQDK